MKKQTKNKKAQKPVERRLTALALIILAIGIVFAAEFAVFGFKEQRRVSDENNNLWTAAVDTRNARLDEAKKRMEDIKLEKDELNNTIAKLEGEKAAQNAKTAKGKAEIERIDKELEMFGAELLSLESEYAKLEKTDDTITYDEESKEGYLCFYFASISALVVSSFTALSLTMASKGRDKCHCK